MSDRKQQATQEIDPLMGWTDITEGAVKALFGSSGGLKQMGKGIRTFAGGISGSAKKRAESAAFRQATQQSFKYGSEAYKKFAKSGRSIEAQHVQNLQAQKARFAGSGASLSGSWDQVVGQQLGQRDTAYKELEQGKERFRKSEPGKYINRAYKTLTLPFQSRKGGGMTGAPRVEDYSGSSLFTRSQFSEMKQPGVKNDADRNAYMSRVNPSFAEYETLTFGTADERTAMQDEISQANEWWAGQQALDDSNAMASGKGSQWDRNRTNRRNI